MLHTPSSNYSRATTVELNYICIASTTTILIMRVPNSHTVIVRGGKRNTTKSTVNKVKFFQMNDINIFGEPFALVGLFRVVSFQDGWP